MFATRKALNNTQLYISYKHGRFVNADFQTELEIKGIHIADVEGKRIMVSGIHSEIVSHLYVSESNSDMADIKFVPSLENVFSYVPDLTWISSWLVNLMSEGGEKRFLVITGDKKTEPPGNVLNVSNSGGNAIRKVKKKDAEQSVPSRSYFNNKENRRQRFNHRDDRNKGTKDSFINMNRNNANDRYVDYRTHAPYRARTPYDNWPSRVRFNSGGRNELYYRDY